GEPARLLRWLRRSHAARLLADLAAAGTHLSHEALDQLPQGHAERYVRGLLVAAGVLPARDDDLYRITIWLDRTLTDRPTAHARLVRPFTHWALLRKARRRAAQGRTSSANGGNLRGHVLLVLDLL